MEQIRYLIVRSEDSLVLGAQHFDDAGPLPAPPECPLHGASLVQFDGDFSRAGRRHTEMAYLLEDGAIEWRDTAVLDDEREAAIETIDSACEDLRLAVISKMTQTEEYKLAEQHAREYRAAGYTGEAGRGVTGWTRAKHRQGWTDRDAADDILATADRWYGLLFDIRDARLAAKEDVRHETEVAAIGAIVAGVQAHMESLALQMNTTTTE
ncbi:hypothetical protein [Massilia haematophila]|uniref:DUF4376 domain-containing protein n=1 Tax=Massilia haematophila TaxID=457923 RepID=A0ABV7PHS8_9BURK